MSLGVLTLLVIFLCLGKDSIFEVLLDRRFHCVYKMNDERKNSHLNVHMMDTFFLITIKHCSLYRGIYI